MPVITITQNTTGGTHSGTEDTFVRQTVPTTNGDSTDYLLVSSEGASDRGNTLIRFTMPGVLSGATINSVTLKLYVQGFTTFKTLGVHRCLRAWTETGATWNKFDGSADWATAGGTGTGDIEATASASVLMSASTSFYQDFTSAGLAADVAAWAGGTANNGWLIKRNDYTAGDGHWAIYNRSEGTDATRPQLVIDYTAGGGGGGSTLLAKLNHFLRA